MDKHYCLIPWIITSKTDMAAHICYAALNIIEKYKEDTEFDTKDIVFIATFSVRLCGMVLGMIFVNYKFQRHINRNRQDGKSARNTTETTEPVSPPSYKTDPPSYKEPITATDPFPKSAPPSYKHNDQPENRGQPENRLVNPSTNVINTRDSLPLLDGPQEWVNEVLFYRNICFPRITLNNNARIVDIEGAGDNSTSAADVSLPATDYAVSIPATDYTDGNPSDLFHAPDGRCVQTTIPIFYAANMYRQLHRQLFAVEYGNANEEIPCEAAALRS
ncbi:uncharacterized protein LOC141906066 [Tubulanus polymorphus]|uniref:uncharacterized protein LOC141906066 n=1 Tax=Tubulanus polymorphus TaxID=672921 RepID=UPI003DA44236